MAGTRKAAVSFDEVIQASRQERNAKLAQEMLGTDPRKLAQEILGSNRRSSTPRAPAAPATFASRVGVVKRSASLPRSHIAPPRNPRQPSHLSRPTNSDNHRPRASAPALPSAVIDEIVNSSLAVQEVVHDDAELNIRGAAAGPYVVQASNFALGTTAADIESVMQNVGGQMIYCKLVASNPTVIAEISFVERAGAEKVIEMFNNKKADGRLLYVYFAPAPSQQRANGDARQQQAQVEEPLPAVVDIVGDTTMEVDEHAEAREAEDRQREERRGRDERAPRLPSGPRRTETDDYSRGERRAQPGYDNGRYGAGGDDRRFAGGRGRYGGRGGMYSDGVRRGGGQSYRP